jgi:hypothetical protein
MIRRNYPVAVSQHKQIAEASHETDISDHHDRRRPWLASVAGSREAQAPAAPPPHPPARA